MIEARERASPRPLGDEMNELAVAVPDQRDEKATAHRSPQSSSSSDRTDFESPESGRASGLLARSMNPKSRKALRTRKNPYVVDARVLIRSRIETAIKQHNAFHARRTVPSAPSDAQAISFAAMGWR